MNIQNITTNSQNPGNSNYMELEKQSMKNGETRKILRKTSDKLKTLLTGDSYKSKDEEEAEENEKKKGRENF
jgi:hypothetical protein